MVRPSPHEADSWGVGDAWPSDGRAHRRRTRVDYAQGFFAPTPVASTFEVVFADRFYAHVARGGSPAVDAFIDHERTRRVRHWLAAGAVATTLLAVVLVTTTPLGYTDLDDTDGFVSAWIASAIMLAVPVLVAVQVARVRFHRRVNQMFADRAAYRSHCEARRQEEAQTTHRLRELGIDL